MYKTYNVPVEFEVKARTQMEATKKMRDCIQSSIKYLNAAWEDVPNDDKKASVLATALYGEPQIL